MFKVSSRQKRENLIAFLFISPWIIGFIVFWIGPFIASVILSFCRYDIITPPRFTGLDNYITMSKDPLFWQSLKVIILYACGRIPLGVVTGLLLATLLNQKIKGVGLFRVIYYAPVVLPPVATSLMWMWMYNPGFGLLNMFIWNFFHIRGPNWLYSEIWVLPALMIMAVWSAVGRNLIIYLAGFASVPEQLYEAAEIDGANRWQKFFKVTIPVLTPVIFFNLVIDTIAVFQLFTQAYVMTGGGPNNASLFFVYYIYQKAFEQFRAGYASSLAWALFIVIMVFSLLIFRSSRLWVYYEGTLKGE